MSIHDGHRKRLKERYLKEGLDNFDELHALELALFYSMGRKDTNPVAHALLERFGSLQQVMDANPEELMKVEGVGEHTAIFLGLIRDMGRYYQVKCAEASTVLQTIDQCGAYLLPYFFGRKNETVFLLCLDAKCKVISCQNMGEGGVNSANISIRKIVEAALRVNATSVVLSHNHPSGLALPSKADVQTTIRLGKALRMVDIILVDHIIVCEDDYISLVQSGNFSQSMLNGE